MLTALARAFPGDEWRAFVPGTGALVGGEAGGAGAAPGAVRLIRRPAPSQLVFAPAALLGRPRIDRLVGGADVVWIPAPAPVAISHHVPYVLTVHDLSWIERPADFTTYERLWHRLGRLERLARSARVVVAVSGATRRAIDTHWPGLADVRVIRSGIPSLPPPAPRPAWLPPRYLLAVGALEPRKAPHLLAQALAEARTNHGLDADLVFAGDGRLATSLRAPGIHVVPTPDRATLAALYEHALALALPSRLEGFGFTPLEAARAGVPVLAPANLPAIDETLGHAALRVPNDHGWADAINTIATDEHLRARLAAAGRTAAARFNWDDAAHRLHTALTDAR